jgi:hypothetical protein
LPSNQPDQEAAKDHQFGTMHTHFRQLALQAAAAFAVLSLAWPYYGIKNLPLPWPWVALSIGGVALVFSVIIRLPWWWRVIHAGFAPMAWLISIQGIPPAWFLFAFFLLLLIYRGAASGQIPLYFSNLITTQALIDLIPQSAEIRFVDLGAGIGSTLQPLSKARKNALITGLEIAPAPWLIALIRSLGRPNCTVRMADFWKEDLADYDVVYAFLSPVPMTDLWDKVQQEMRPGGLFISNTFAVPGVSASSVVEVQDARQTKLYCYQR